jgi:hypothetical protein
MLRILLNCSQNLAWDLKVKHANKMMRKLQYSGYNHGFRYEIATSAIKAYKKIMEDVEDGNRPLYRPKGYKAAERKEAKKKKKKEWYTKGGYESVIFVPATPNSMMKKSCEAVLKESNFKMKIVEKSGTQLKRILQTSNPFRKEQCSDADKCFVCTSGEKKNCRKTEIKYHINCDDEACKEHVYHGESSRNGFTRGNEQFTAFKKHEEGSNMWKHCVLKHGGEETTFKMKIDRTFRKDPMLRQITEAIEINDTPEEYRMNSKAEWHLPKVPRVQIGTE